jgi:hypothetical protein
MNKNLKNVKSFNAFHNINEGGSFRAPANAKRIFGIGTKVLEDLKNLLSAISKVNVADVVDVKVAATDLQKSLSMMLTRYIKPHADKKTNESISIKEPKTAKEVLSIAETTMANLKLLKGELAEVSPTPEFIEILHEDVPALMSDLKVLIALVKPIASKANELFHGTDSGVGQSGGAGSKTVGKFMTKVGAKFGNKADILTRYLDSKVEDKTIDQAQANEIERILSVKINKMNKEQIHKLVDTEIEGYK